MQAVTGLDRSLSDGFVVLTTVTVAARAAPGGGATAGAGDDRPSKPARRFKKDIGDWN